MEARYKIYERLGAGGVGAVFRAYDSQLKRWVAIKRLLNTKEVQSDDPLAAELRKEADSLATLRHPNIVTIFDVASDEEGLFMVMELLQGEDLGDFIARGPLAYDDFKELATQTLEGLLSAHQNHILHRDIKPENIKVERLPGGRLQAKIIDFGLARAGLRARKQTEDHTGTVMGSIFFMAPEQLTRQPVDERTDLYALGCVFYEALSGRKAFDGETVEEIIDKHINHDIVPIHVVAPHLQPWLAAWVMRLMAQKPEDRPINAQQAIEEFRAWEKMAILPYGPWMAPVPGYSPMPGYGVAAPMPYGAPGMPQPTTGVQPVVEEPVYYATPVEEPLVPGAGTASMTPGPATSQALPRGPQRPVPPVRSSPAATAAKKPVLEPPGGVFADPKKRNFILIGSAAVVALGVGFALLRGSGKESVESGGSASQSVLGPSGPPKVSFELPRDRNLPPLSDALCMHFVPNTGALSARKDAKGDHPPAGNNEIVVEWRDLAPKGNDNFLRGFSSKPENSPRRLAWPTQQNAPTVKGNRVCLDFRPRDGKLCAMNLTDPSGEIQHFPFGSEGGKWDAGLTLAVVFQADAKDPVMRVCTLKGKGDSGVTLSVDKDKNIVASVKAQGKAVTLKSSGVNATLPLSAIVVWDAAKGEVLLRARDASGKTSRGPAEKVASPGEPLASMQIGRVKDASGQDVPAAEAFRGFLGDVLVFSGVVPGSQLDLLEGQLKDWYFQPPPPKPTAASKK